MAPLPPRDNPPEEVPSTKPLSLDLGCVVKFRAKKDRNIPLSEYKIKSARAFKIT